MRVPVDFRQSSKELYEEFVKESPEIKISYDKFKDVIYGFNYLFRDYILETGELVKYPFGGGEFSVEKKHKKKIKVVDGKEYVILPVDWKRTKELGKKVYIFNSHSDGYSFKWFWTNLNARFHLADTFMFKPFRESSRKLKDYVTKPNSLYIDKYKKYSRK